MFALFPAASTRVVAGGPSQGLDPANDLVPVIVELFTSEGCSSCPPADRLLRELHETQPVEGADVIALGEHVDYWDYLGWKDRFSSSGFSERQREYAEAWGTNRIYTPQMIVDGRTEFVGGRKDRATEAIRQGARMPKAPVRIHYLRSWADQDRQNIRLQAWIGQLPTSGESTLDVYLALTESRLQSAVRAGENAGRVLRHAPVVRRLEVIGTVDGRGPVSVESTVVIEPDWQSENLRVAVFVQERESRQVVAAGATAPGQLLK